MAVRPLAAVDRANQSSKVVPVGVSATRPSLGHGPRTCTGQCPATLQDTYRHRITSPRRRKHT